MIRRATGGLVVVGALTYGVTGSVGTQETLKKIDNNLSAWRYQTLLPSSLELQVGYVSRWFIRNRRFGLW